MTQRALQKTIERESKAASANSTTPPCPECGYDLAGTVASGGNRCPECGWEFTPQDLILLGPSNLGGVPRSLRPKEPRLGGRWLLLLLAIISIVFVVTTVYLAGR